MRKYKDGDVITSTASPPTSGLFFHRGIILMKKGVPYVYHNTPTKTNPFGGNILLEPLSEYLAAGRKMLSVESTNMTRKELLARNEWLKTKKFHWFEFNCEHYVSGMVDGEPKSSQIKKWGLCIGVGLGIAVYLAILIRNKKRN